MNELSHFDDAGNVKMVDVSGKESTTRRAVASCRVLELGCAAGGNLLPMAASLPDSEFVGIDIAPVAPGQHVARRGLAYALAISWNDLDAEVTDQNALCEK